MSEDSGNQTQPAAGNAETAVVKYRAHEITYDRASDILSFDGFKFSGDLMRTFTATPVGTMFRIKDRQDDRGTLTVSYELDPVAAAAPDMLAALKAAAVYKGRMDPETRALVVAALSKAEPAT